MTQNTVVPGISPTQPTFSDKLSAIGAKISRSLSRDISVSEEGNTGTTGSLKDRSQSRGREFHSTGRGGVGNIRPNSTSRDARPGEGSDNLSPTRGRERPNPVDLSRSYSTGRGGAGNIRDPSRDGRSPLRSDLQEELESEDVVIKAHSIAEQDMPFSTGRGGAGNIARSRSRGPADLSPTHPHLHHVGRGGAGNVVAGEGLLTEVLDDKPRRSRSRGADVTIEHPHVHSTGRGGTGNIVPDVPEVVEVEEDRLNLHHPQGVHSTGRGGAGNITVD